MHYYAKIKKQGGAYLVSFPDMPNVNTYGDTIEEAIKNAGDAVNGVLQADFGRGFELPQAREYKGRGYYRIAVAPHIAVAYQLRELRRGQSQGEIARKLGVSYQAVQKLENPKSANPSIKTLEKIAEIFGKRLELSFT